MESVRKKKKKGYSGKDLWKGEDLSVERKSEGESSESDESIKEIVTVMGRVEIESERLVQ